MVIFIDGGEGCVEPSAENVSAGKYVPLARPLFIYVAVESAARPEVQSFVQFFVDNQDAIVTEALYVPLDDTQKGQQAEELAVILGS